MGGEQDWHGDRDRERVRRIADALHKLTGHRPTQDTRKGVTKISLQVVDRPDRAQTQAVLRVLGYGDRFGHSRTARWERVWVEVGEPRPARPEAESAPLSPPTG
ncbi:hypothetical protein [Kitasatospora sp. NPDC004531]